MVFNAAQVDRSGHRITRLEDAIHGGYATMVIFAGCTGTMDYERVPPLCRRYTRQVALAAL